MKLLPFNATDLEKSLEIALDYNVDPLILRGFKYKNPDPDNNMKIALSWEYSLSQVAVDNFGERIKQGLEFHRFKGTKYAVILGLSWYNLKNVVVEEEEYGQHFYEFQIGIEGINNNFPVEKVVEIAQLAAPLRSRLTRIYNHDYDVRRFILDYSDWGDLLSDYSGAILDGGGPKMSFGRKHTMGIPFFEALTQSMNSREYWNFVKNEDTFKLDFARLDDPDVWVKNYDMTIFTERYIYNDNQLGTDIPEVLFDPSTQAKAAVVLSDYVLEDLNTCFSGYYEENNDKPFELSFNLLSETKSTTKTHFIDERFFRQKQPEYALADINPIVTNGLRTRIIGGWLQNKDSTVEVSRNSTKNIDAKYQGNNNWHEHQHFDTSWNQQSWYTRMR